MKKLLPVFFACISLQLMAQPWKTIKGDGNLKKESRTVADFSALSANGPFDVQIAYGTSGDLQVEADENLLPYIETKVEDGKLTIRVKEHVNIKSQSRMVVYISMTEIKSLHESGSGNISGSGAFRNDGKTDIKVSGSGDIKLDFDSFDDLDLAVSGSGNVHLKGSKAGDVSAAISGSGNIDCMNVPCDNVKAKISGSGNIKIDARQSIDASISGSGNVYYKEDVDNINSKVSGSGKVRKI
jgi:hypothetical protein